MRVPPWPEAVGEPEEVGLVDGAQHLSDRSLDDLVLQGRDTERALPAIGLWDVDASNRLRSVASGVDTHHQILKVGLQVLRILVHRYPVDSRTCPPLLTPKRPCERLDIKVMQQSSESGLGGLAGRCV